jgi:hypothetical protein
MFLRVSYKTMVSTDSPRGGRFGSTRRKINGSICSCSPHPPRVIGRPVPVLGPAGRREQTFRGTGANQ